jgi:citrate synthase
VLADRLRRGEPIPGFGHALYPEGDPRARKILALLQDRLPAAPVLELAAALSEAAYQRIGEHPTLDLALAVLARALELPPGSALAIFALGRTAGWLAHAIEQYETGQLIRPRARYTGPQV